MIYLRNFKNGDFDVGNTVYIDSNVFVSGVFKSVKAGPESKLYDIGKLCLLDGSFKQGVFSDNLTKWTEMQL